MKDKNNSTVTIRTIGFSSILTIVFIVLKLVGTIAWSWVWVLAPLWISIGLKVVVFLAICIVLAICSWITKS